MFTYLQHGYRIATIDCHHITDSPYEYHRRTGHFWRGTGSILPEKYGAAPEKRMPHPKVLAFRALYFAVACAIFSYFSLIIFIMLFFSFFGRCPKTCSIARKKLFCPTLGAAAPLAPQLIHLRDYQMGQS